MYTRGTVLYRPISTKPIENRIYIREELKESLGMNFFSPFQPEREFKVYKSCKCSQIICIWYMWENYSTVQTGVYLHARSSKHLKDI